MSRRKEREQAFLLVFEGTFLNKDLNIILENKKFCQEEEISDFAKNIFLGVSKNIKKIENLIEENITGWDKDRLSRVALVILKIAIYEMFFVELIPVDVSIFEAVQLAQKYGSEDDFAFVNGVLGAISRKMPIGVAVKK